jgi:hypothetical protein
VNGATPDEHASSKLICCGEDLVLAEPLFSKQRTCHRSHLEREIWLEVTHDL